MIEVVFIEFHFSEHSSINLEYLHVGTDDFRTRGEGTYGCPGKKGNLSVPCGEYDGNDCSISIESDMDLIPIANMRLSSMQSNDDRPQIGFR